MDHSTNAPRESNPRSLEEAWGIAFRLHLDSRMDRGIIGDAISSYAQIYRDPSCVRRVNAFDYYNERLPLWGETEISKLYYNSPHMVPKRDESGPSSAPPKRRSDGDFENDGKGWAAGRNVKREKLSNARAEELENYEKKISLMRAT